jgi:peptide deformylase
MADESEPTTDDEIEEFEAELDEDFDEERRELRRAALRHIRQWGDPVLRSVASEVKTFDDALRNDALNMAALMEDAIGAGLAAPQVGSLRRMFVYRADRDGEVVTVVNPNIVWRSAEEEIDFEGCLSLSEVLVEVSRPVAVKVEAQDLEGNPVTIKAEGFEARVIQHEYDHLEGVMIIDRADADQRREALRRLRSSSAQGASS